MSTPNQCCILHAHLTDDTLVDAMKGENLSLALPHAQNRQLRDRSEGGFFGRAKNAR